MTRTTYIWERPDWPRFRWREGELLVPLAEARRKQGLLLGGLRRIGFDMRLRAELEAVVEEAVTTSAIEGETLDRARVRSSVARRLGLLDVAAPPADRHTEGLVEMLLDATHRYASPLDAETLLGWHGALFPTGRAGLHRIVTGAWRPGPVQVVSGPIGREHVHFEGPPAARVEAEMERFLDWFERSRTDPALARDGLVRAGLAHLWLVTIHPFEDGNGRIARAVTERALAQDEGLSQRFYGMSAAIRAEREGYYRVLERTQKEGLDVTSWLVWFLACLGRALDAAEAVLERVLAKAAFWQGLSATDLNPRQRKVLNRVLDGFEGNLTTRKWAALGKCSIATAQRDINDLLGQGVLTRNPGGSRRTSYRLAAASGAEAAPDQPLKTTVR
ncbi:MAG TPA: Fic family protein [Geminicoccaceae bacterium]|nr:Fic family protein [Geminicoccaceae bacterium]